MAKDHGSNIKDDAQHERLREQGMSKEKAARIANTPRDKAARSGGKAEKYDDWAREQLLQRAKEIGIDSPSTIKEALIDALRNH